MQINGVFNELITINITAISLLISYFVAKNLFYNERQKEIELNVEKEFPYLKSFFNSALTKEYKENHILDRYNELISEIDFLERYFDSVTQDQIDDIASRSAKSLEEIIELEKCKINSSIINMDFLGILNSLTSYKENHERIIQSSQKILKNKDFCFNSYIEEISNETFKINYLIENLIKIKQLESHKQREIKLPIKFIIVFEFIIGITFPILAIFLFDIGILIKPLSDYIGLALGSLSLLPYFTLLLYCLFRSPHIGRTKHLKNTV